MKKRVMTSSNLSVLQFENHKLPEIKELKNRDWITYGEKNDYPEYLIQLFDRSAKHNAIITGKVHYIKGNGIEVDATGMTVEQKAKLINWYNNINTGDCSTDLLTKVITDIEIFDGCYIEVIPNRIGNGIAELNHIGFEKLRVSKNKDGYWYSNDWSKYRQSAEETGLKFLPFYDPLKFTGVFRYKAYRPGPRIYPIPEYVGCISYIEIDYEIANFHLNNIKNGFVGGTMISFNNGTPTMEEQKVIEGKVKGKFTGTDKAGQLVITFSDNKDSAPTVTPLLPNGFDKMFDTLNQTVMQEIFTGHKITSLALFGIKEANGLGSKDELRDAYTLFQNGYVNAKQKIVESIFNDFAESCGYGRPFSIIPIEPISEGIPQEEVIKVMTSDEIRLKAGLPSLTQEKMKSHFCSVDNFKKYGKNKDEFKIYKSTEVSDRNDVMINELSFYRTKFYDEDVIVPKIVDLIQGNPNISLSEIAKVVGLSSKEIEVEINNLLTKKLIQGKIGSLEVTESGTKIIEEAPIENIEILYSYEVRKNLPPLQTESRDFCQNLLDLNKLYTRQEIELISEEEGRDVWATRGGYFHNTALDQTTPYCRHIWVQNIVRKK